MYSVFQGPPLRRYGGVHARSRGRAACAREDSMWPLLQQAFRHADDQPVESIGVVAGLLRFQRNTGSVIVLSSMCLPVTERFVTVQESARHHSLSRVLRAIRTHRKLNTTYYPWIKLAGVWLEDAGFEAGERVRITVEDKRLIITPM